MQLASGLRSHISATQKNNLLSASPSIRRPTEDQWLKTKQKPKSFEKIEENETIIASLRERLSRLMEQDKASLSLLGLETENFETVARLQKELRALSRQRDKLKSHREAVKNGNVNFINTPVAEDFTELQEFFPTVNIRELTQIEHFHKLSSRKLKFQSPAQKRRIIIAIAQIHPLQCAAKIGTLFSCIFKIASL